MNKEDKEYMEGDKTTCPNCGGIEFCIGKDEIWTEGEFYADCIDCKTSTLVGRDDAEFRFKAQCEQVLHLLQEPSYQ